jgi:hypothetical protein
MKQAQASLSARSKCIMIRAKPTRAVRLFLGGHPPEFTKEIGAKIAGPVALNSGGDEGQELATDSTVFIRRQVDGGGRSIMAFVAEHCTEADAAVLLSAWLTNPHVPLSEW